jgi:hypothetical protein
MSQEHLATLKKQLVKYPQLESEHAELSVMAAREKLARLFAHLALLPSHWMNTIGSYTTIEFGFRMRKPCFIYTCGFVSYCIDDIGGYIVICSIFYWKKSV